LLNEVVAKNHEILRISFRILPMDATCSIILVI